MALRLSSVVSPERQAAVDVYNRRSFGCKSPLLTQSHSINCFRAKLQVSLWNFLKNSKGGRAGGPGWGGGGELQVCNRNSSGWRAQIGSCGRLPAVSFVPSDAPAARAPAPSPCLPPKGGSRLSAGALCPEGLGQKAARIPYNSRFCRRCSPHSWALSTGCFLCAWLSGTLCLLGLEER